MYETRTGVIGAARLRSASIGAAVFVSLLVACGTPPAPAAAQGTDLDGAWRADRYELNSGVSHALAGHIMFVDGEWNVLFYVLDGTGEPVRMSAEGGTFTRSGETLVFTHLYFAAQGEAVEGLEASPFEMRVNRGDPVVEPSTATVEGDMLTLFFPSGNRMTFQRAHGS